MFLNLCTVGVALYLAFSIHIESAPETSNTTQKIAEVPAQITTSTLNANLEQLKALVLTNDSGW
jgi:hypothetical protein